MSLVELQEIHKVFGSGAHAVPAVRGVTLAVDLGETLGLVGESGCGKSTLARVVVGLTEASGGTILFDGEDVTTKVADRVFRRKVQMVSQHPGQSLNPRFRVETTLAEPLKMLGVAEDPAEVSRRIDEMLTVVGLSPEYRRRRPRSLSGGQQQRVAIARALMSEPELVVLDEPTSSLDQSIRGRIVALLRKIQERRDVAYLFISHDLSTVRRIADRVAVMYLGRIVEMADTTTIFDDPRHPYTRALLSAVPSIDVAARRERIVLPGETPSPASLPPGCSFQDRCPLVHDRCRVEDPRLMTFASGHDVACFAVVSAASG
jgi:oligopeptide/dipeptide ABC transporter ATP-binding protein